MAIDFTRDYSEHVLLDNKRKYREIYKLAPSEASDISKGDLVLLKSACGCYNIFMAIADADEDGTLHLTKYSEMEFAKMDDSSSSDSIVLNETSPCIC